MNKSKFESKIIHSLLLAFLVTLTSYAQNCPTSSWSTIYLSDQASIDAFKTNYPDCSVLNYNLRIEGDDITNLAGLSNLKSIHGNLNITDCPNLAALNGLENVKNIDADLRIHDNEILSDISAISDIEGLDGDFVLDELPLLSILGEFTKLDSVNGELRIDEVLNLPANTFPNLQHVKKINIRNNLFTSLEGFAMLSSIGEISINNNPNITLINGFSLLKEIDQNLTIDNNGLLQSIIGFGKLESITNSLYIQNCPLLKSMDNALNSLETIGDNFFIEGVGIVNFANFQKLHKTGPLHISNNHNLVSLTGLENIKIIEGDLIINNNQELSDIGAIENVDYENMVPHIATSPFDDSYMLIIKDNVSLNKCDIQVLCGLLKRTSPFLIKILNNGNGCNEVEEVLIGQCKSHQCYEQGLYLNLNEEIDSLFKDLPVCNYILGDLILGANTDISTNKTLDLSKLSFIDTIMGDIIIENTLLKEIKGLTKIKHVGGKVRIINNPNLEVADFFLKADNYKELIVKDNPKLKKFSRFQLTDMEGSIHFENNPMLEELDIKCTNTHVGDISVVNNPLLNLDLDFTKLNHLIGNLTVKNIDRNQFVNVKKISGNLTIEGLTSHYRFSLGIDTIFGNLLIKENPNVSTINLNIRHISGDYNIINNQLLDQLGHTGSNRDRELRYIGGDLRIINTRLNNIALSAEMQFLRTIGGAFVITQNPNLESLSTFNSLIYNTTSSITITDNPKLEDCNLKTLCWNIRNNSDNVIISNNKGKCNNYQVTKSNCNLDTCISGLQASRQETIDRWLEINEVCSIIPGDLKISDKTPNFDTVSLLGLKNIETVLGDVTLTGRKLVSIEGLEKLNHIAGDLVFSENHSFFDMKTLRNLESIDGTLMINHSSIKNFIGLENLKRVGELRIEQEDNFESFEGLQSLKRIDKGLRLRFLNIKTLSGLDNLEYIGENIELFSLHKLTDITALKNLSAEPLKTIRITNNSRLTNCDFQVFCEFLNLNPTYKHVFSSNGEGCFDDDLDCVIDRLSGTVYYDKNKNGLKDSTEYGIPGVGISDNSKTFFSNESGRYRLFSKYGEPYSISLENLPNWTLTSSLSGYTGIIDSSNFVKKYDFGLYPNKEKHDFDISISSKNIRCSETGKYYIKIQNTGTYTESGELHLKFDSRLNLKSSNQVPSLNDTEKSILKWELKNLEPYETIEISLDFELPNYKSTGDILVSELEIYRNEKSQLQLASNFTYETVLRCSYDPNDKQVNPVGKDKEAYILKDEPLNYTIRFQNTGNDYARNIKLIDTLPKEVNLSSFKVINSSHDVYTELNEYEVTFNFDNIYLVDSFTNSDLSQGFVSFQVELQNDIDDFTLIENDAEIFFDFNPPIRTNKVINTAVEGFTTTAHDTNRNSKFAIYPNPTRSTLEIFSDQPAKVKIYDSSLNLVKFIDLNDKSFKVDMSTYQPGLYFISFKLFTGDIFWDRIVKF